MKRYKVKSLSVGGINKVYYSGAEVSEANFPAGNCPELVAKGFLEEIPEKGSAISPNKDFNKKGPAGKPSAPKTEDKKPSEADLLAASGLTGAVDTGTRNPEEGTEGGEGEKSEGDEKDPGADDPGKDGADGENQGGEKNPDKGSNSSDTKSFTDADGNTKEVLSIDDITRNQIIAELKAAKVEFGANESKAVLFDLWMSL